MKKIIKIVLVLVCMFGIVACSQSEEDKEFTIYKTITVQILDEYISNYKTSFKREEWTINKQENDITVISSKIEYKDEKPRFTIIITDMTKEDEPKFIKHFVKVGKDIYFDDNTVE